MSISTPLPYSTLPRQRRHRGALARTAAWLVSALFWAMLAGILVVGTTWAVAAGAGVAFGVIAGIGIILLLVAGAILARGARRVRDLAVLSYFDQAVRLNIPLAGMLTAAERNESGSVRARLAILRARLDAGDTVAVALSMAAPALPRRMTALIAAGENTGRLAASIRRVTAAREFFPAANPVDSIYSRWYPMVLLIFTIAVGEVVLVFAMPRLDRTLHDFHLPAPAMKALEPAALYYGIILLAICALAMLILCGRMLALIFTPGRVTLGPLRKAADALIWFTPIIGGVVRNQSLADACHVICGACDAGLPPADAIAEAGRASTNIIMQRRLRKWSFRLNNGDALAAAAKTAKLPRLLSQLLATAQTDADVKEVFDFLCRHYDGKFSRAALLFRAAIIPACAIGFGLIVGGLALGVFQPLVDLIQKIAGH